MTDEFHCDDCGKELDECPFWIAVSESLQDIDNFLEFDSAEEYIKYLEDDI